MRRVRFNCFSGSSIYFNFTLLGGIKASDSGSAFSGIEVPAVHGPKSSSSLDDEDNYKINYRQLCILEHSKTMSYQPNIVFQKPPVDA